MPTFRKKPVEIEAFRLGGDSEPDWFVDAVASKTVSRHSGRSSYDPCMSNNHCVSILTLEGTMYANLGDYVIKGVKGELYPCKPDIFAMTYELVEAQP